MAKHNAWLVVVSIFLALLVWALGVKWGNPPAYLLPSPLLVWQKFILVLKDGTLLQHALVTFNEVLSGLVIGSCLATLLGYLLAKSSVLEKLLSPYLVASQAIPLVAIAPLLVIWFGPGMFSKVLICAMIVFFPVLVNTILGFRGVPENLRDLMQSMRATRWQKLRLLEIPAALPMNGRRGVVGILCVGTCQPQPLDDLEVQFVQAISSWMATAIENVHLNEAGKRLAVLEERDRFGMDLHDGIIQSIYAVGLTLEHARLLMPEDPPKAVSRIDQAIKDLNHTIRDIRAYILDLRPRQLNNENLMQGIQRLVQEFRANTLIDVNIQGSENELKSLPETHAVALFHICQESLANIAKHAKAHHVEIVVWATQDRALLEVQDDGRGFDLNKVKTTIGHGLSNIETRANNVGGAVDISSEPGKGTSVLAWVPIPPEEFESLIVE